MYLGYVEENILHMQCRLHMLSGVLSVQVEWEFWTNSNDECGATCDTQRKFVKVRRACLYQPVMHSNAGHCCLVRVPPPPTQDRPTHVLPCLHRCRTSRLLASGLS